MSELSQALNFHMARIADRLDALEGHRDRPTFYQNPKLWAAEALGMLRTDIDKIIDTQFTELPSYNAKDHGVVDTEERTLKNLVDEIGTSKKATITLNHTGTGNTTLYTLATSLTIPSNIALVINNGAIIDGAGTLTINGPLDAGLYQCFGSSVAIAFGAGAVREAHVEWKDAKGDGTTNDAVALQAIIDSGAPHIKFGYKKTYLSESILTGINNQIIDLNQATLKGGGDNSAFNICGLHHIYITNGTIDGDIASRGSTSGVYGIQGVAAHDCEVSHVKFIGQGAGSGRTVTSGICVVFEANDDVNYSESSVIGASYSNTVHKCVFDDEYVSFGIRFKTAWDDALTSSECYDNHAYRNRFVTIGKSAIEIAGHKTHSCTAEFNTVVLSKIDGMDIDKGAYNCSISFNSIGLVADSALGGGTNQFGGITVASIEDATNGSLYATNNRIIGNVINSTRRTGVRIAGARKTIVTDNQILEAGLVGISLTQDGTSTLNNANNVVKGNVISGLGNFNGGSVSTVPQGISSSLGSDNIIEANIIADSIYRGVHVTNSTNDIVLANKIETAPNAVGSYPIYINTSNGVQALGNKINQTGAVNTTGLIYILTSDDIVVVGNWGNANTATDHGIQTVNTADNVIISANYFQNHANAIVIDLVATGTGYVVTDNIGDTSSTVNDGTGDGTAIIRHGIEAANADTSGANLAQLETEVNELKAALRAQSVIQ